MKTIVSAFFQFDADVPEQYTVFIRWKHYIRWHVAILFIIVVPIQIKGIVPSFGIFELDFQLTWRWLNNANCWGDLTRAFEFFWNRCHQHHGRYPTQGPQNAKCQGDVWIFCFRTCNPADQPLHQGYNRNCNEKDKGTPGIALDLGAVHRKILEGQQHVKTCKQGHQSCNHCYGDHTQNKEQDKLENTHNKPTKTASTPPYGRSGLSGKSAGCFLRFLTKRSGLCWKVLFPFAGILCKIFLHALHFILHLVFDRLKINFFTFHFQFFGCRNRFGHNNPKDQVDQEPGAKWQGDGSPEMNPMKDAFKNE